VRIYRSEPTTALALLAELDSRRPATGPMLVAEVEGEPRAALPLDGGAPFADPFRLTGELVSLLELRARQLRGEAPGPRRIVRVLARVRPVPAR
jgi:hypothetical protein